MKTSEFLSRDELVIINNHLTDIMANSFISGKSV